MELETAAAPDDAPAGGDNGEGGRYRVPALERGLDIFELLSTAEAGLSRAQLAEAIGCSVSQIFRMLDCLQRRKVLSLDPRGNRLALTSQLFEIAPRDPPPSPMTSLQIAGIHNFSFPVLDVTGKAVAAMTMPFLVRTDIHSNLDDSRNILRDAAMELSRQLGHVPDDLSG